jgi:arylsulfatase A-like enzyme/Tfp pilus assembly protein PilF
MLRRALVGSVLLGGLVAAAPYGRSAAQELSRANLLLVTLDTVRADHLGAYGSKTAATPVLDRLAREGVRFAQAISQAPLTGPAHAALLTGMYPGRFGVRDNAATPLPPQATTLAEMLGKAGYQTGGFIGAFILDRAYGFDQGFDLFDSRFERFEVGDKLAAERRADEVVAPAIAWLSKLDTSRPFFAWVHLYDAHAPYQPPAPFSQKFAASPYDGEIAYVDSAVGKLIVALERGALLDRTLIVAIGDHGESLGEHGEEDHGFFLYDAVLRIPWIARLPAAIRPGTVVADQARAIDLVPTVLDWLKLPSPGRFDGASVAARPVAGDADVPTSYAETYYSRFHFGWSELKSARVGEWKYIDAPRPELYDLRKDPKEQLNVIDRNQGVAARLSAELRQVVQSFGAGADVRPSQPDPETLARLRSLGYVGLAAPATGSGRGADPKDKIAGLMAFRKLLTEATDDVRRQQPAVAIPKLKRALQLDGLSYDAHLLFGDAHLALQQFDSALGEYEAAGVLNPTSAAPLLSAARVLTDTERFDQAEARIAAAATLEPNSHEVSMARGRLRERQMDFGAALREYVHAVDQNPSDALARARLANLALQLRLADIAETQGRALLAMGYQPARTHYGLGRAAELRGDRASAIREYEQAIRLDPSLTEARAALARVKASIAKPPAQQAGVDDLRLGQGPGAN